MPDRSKKLWLALLLIVYYAVSYLVMKYYNIGCVFRTLFGIPCPGCGMTRALQSLMRWEICRAARYHVVVFFLPYVFAYLFFDWKHKVHNFLLGGIAVLAILNWIIKLIVFLGGIENVL